MVRRTQICFIGSGAIATALGNILAQDEDIRVRLISIEAEVVESIQKNHLNNKYFPNFYLSPLLQASLETRFLSEADIIFLAIPSSAIQAYFLKHGKLISSDALIVNLAKGFGMGSLTIPELIQTHLSNKVASMKGPSFAREIINKQPTGFTVATSSENSFSTLSELFEDSIIHLDYTTDCLGVEYASILKNIYAIVIGIVDAHFDSPNLRSLVLTKSINEMKSIITSLGGKEETLFKFCGFGDFSLTALNDLSRNRTLGLLIGKGFFTPDISKKVVLEGRIATQVFVEDILQSKFDMNQFPIIRELYKVFGDDYDVSNFVERVLG